MAPQGPPPPPPAPQDRGQSPWGPRPDDSERPEQNRPASSQGWPKWSVWVVLVVFIGLLVLLASQGVDSSKSPTWGEFQSQVKAGQVQKASYNNTTGTMTWTSKDGKEYTTGGPIPLSDADRALLDSKLGDNMQYKTPTTGLLENLLPLLIPALLIIGFFVFMQRRAQGQVNGIMSIGRSKAKTYASERPGTTFADVAGYEGVKQEIKEVVDFLKFPERFAQIGARIPKGVLLVGPPGTGKTLIARAVAGEAGVPFLSVSGSDFMEMFVGVGASRVRDLFQNARKLGKAIIFVDEIDSIGRKRGAGLGGGHDEREQTLNQMLSEMDGFEATEGIVMMAATNRPDILDPALLRPGRFDRQVVVPLPEFEERKAILAVHCKGKMVAPDVDLAVVARGTPGMSGADLSNLVNEAALVAVRGGSTVITLHHFEYARDRILMGQARESMALSPAEKETTAYHEAGHAICAAVLPNADPVHKVTIIPRGMALGVTQTVPQEDRHSYSKETLDESLIMMMGGRVAEKLVFGHLTTGASNDLQRATDRAKAMVRELGMSDRIGPRAWGSHGTVFLGEDLVQHNADYGEDVGRIIDEEIDRMLREAEERCTVLLTEYRASLDLVARQLLEHETIDGTEVNRLIELTRTPPGAPTAGPEASTPGAPGANGGPTQPYDIHHRTSHDDGEA